MSIRPGAIVFTVMPSGPSSRASVFSQPTTPGRTAFESARFAIGSFTDVDSIAMMRPRPLARRWGRQSVTSRTWGMSRSSTAATTEAASTAVAAPGGGPPPLRTRMSMPPNASTVRRDEPLEIGGVGQVSRHGERADPRRFALDHVAATGEHRHVRAFGGERLGDRQAHALRGAEHDGAASLKSEVHGARSVPGRTVQVAQRRGQA